MSARKDRIRVVLDTNIFVRNFKSRSKASPNCKVIRLWLVEKRLQLIVSREIVAEYLEIFEEILTMDAEVVAGWHERFILDPRSTFVNLGRTDDESRDPDDNVFLSTARAGKAKYLVTNDKDLLDVSKAFKRTLPFVILTPAAMLTELDSDR
jgi:putative PIN family toxin of toxin-antitoxin system